MKPFDLANPARFAASSNLALARVTLRFLADAFLPCRGKSKALLDFLPYRELPLVQLPVGRMWLLEVGRSVVFTSVALESARQVVVRLNQAWQVVVRLKCRMHPLARIVCDSAFVAFAERLGLVHAAAWSRIGRLADPDSAEGQEDPE
jgi:hypothetical protein